MKYPFYWKWQQMIFRRIHSRSAYKCISELTLHINSCNITKTRSVHPKQQHIQSYLKQYFHQRDSVGIFYVLRIYIKLFKHKKRYLRHLEEGYLHKQNSIQPKQIIHILVPVGNQQIQRWKKRLFFWFCFFCPRHSNKNNILANMSCCHSSIKCITWPYSRPVFFR